MKCPRLDEANPCVLLHGYIIDKATAKNQSRAHELSITCCRTDICLPVMYFHVSTLRTVGCYRYQLHGKEGLEAGLIAWRRTTSSITSTKKTFKSEGIDWIPGVTESDKRKIRNVTAENQELKTDDCVTEAKNKDNTSAARKRSREGDNAHRVTWKKAKGI